MPPFDPSMFIIPTTEPKPIVNLPSEPEVCLIRIPNLESDDDSDSDETLDELYHFEETDLEDVSFEWFDPYNTVDNDGWNEMTDTEEELESEPETKLVPKQKVEPKPELGPKIKTKPEHDLDTNITKKGKAF